MSVMAEQQETVEWPSTLHQFWPREDRPLTVDDMLRVPDDGNRYELANGVLVVTPAPFGIHDLVVNRLLVILSAICPEDFEAFAGLGHNLAKDLHRIPDLTLVRMDRFEDEFQTVPPLLAVEVASRSTRQVDRTTKKQEYAAFGIQSYWIVTPDKQRPSLTAYELRGKKYVQVALVAGAEKFETEKPFPMTIVPSLLVDHGSGWRSLIR